MTGDYVVLSENFSGEENLEKGNFDAGIRFYIRSEDILRHPGYIFDGYHPAKVKDAIVLVDYLHSCIVPEQFKNELECLILPELRGRVYYLSQDHLGLVDWNWKVYNFVSGLQ